MFAHKKNGLFINCLISRLLKIQSRRYHLRAQFNEKQVPKKKKSTTPHEKKIQQMEAKDLYFQCPNKLSTDKFFKVM